MKLSLGLIIVSILSLTACTSEIKEETTSMPEAKEEVVAAPKIDITEDQLASKTDPVCGMPAFKFLADTAIYHGKTYGFCGAGCKMSFMETPDAFIEKLK